MGARAGSAILKKEKEERQVKEEAALFPSVTLAEEGHYPWELKAEPDTDMECALVSIFGPRGKRHGSVLVSCESLAEFARGVLAMIEEGKGNGSR